MNVPKKGTTVPNLGFIQLSLMGYVVAGLVIVVLILMLALKVQTARLESAKAEHATFVSRVKALGEAAELRTKEKIKDQERASNERIKSLESRLANTRREFDRLRNSPGRSELPPVPETARATDDDARDQQLLGLLQHAQEQTDRLIELQEWVRQQER